MLNGSYRKLLLVGAAVFSVIGVPAPSLAAPAQPPTVESKSADTKVDVNRQRANADAAVAATKARALLDPFQDEFIAVAGPGAQQVQTEYNIPASVTAGQAILESNWGRSLLSVNDKNYFGFKCTNPTTPGPIAIGCHEYKTQECTPDCHDVFAYFRVYNTMTDSFRDYGRLITTSSFYSAALPFRNDPDRFIIEVAKHYATDPNYALKVTNLMVNFNLYRFNSVSVSVVVRRSSLTGLPWGENLQVYGRAMPGAHLQQRAYTPTTGWVPWADLDKAVDGKPVEIQVGNDLHVFVVSSPDRHLYDRVYKQATGWDAWQDLGGVVDGTPAVAVFGNKLHVFARDVATLHLAHKVLSPTTGWGDWEDLGNTIQTSPTVIKFGTDLHVFAVASPTGHLLEKVLKPATGWDAWQDLGGVIDGTPAVAIQGGKLHLITRAVPSLTLFDRVLDPTTGWADWTDIGGTVETSPAVIVYNNQIQLFITGSPNKHMYQRSYDGTAWSGWIDHGGVIAGTPAVTQYFNEIHAFAVGIPSYNVFQKVYTPGAPWTDWISHGNIIG